ncbi:MAG: inorganic diphosphatase [Myxococcales bacterium]|jgi:inorganic pyrophosphatase|nr:inorganic diphosphatase [Myxococcales bacterium]
MSVIDRLNEEDGVEIEIETPRFSFIKRKSSGRIDFISPLPSLFNYGFIPGTLAPDGDPQDALLLGVRLPRGARVRAQVQGKVRFVDAGERDDKLVCKAGPLTQGDRWTIEAFFAVYAAFKRTLNAARGRPGRTAFAGLEEREGASFSKGRSP